MVKYSCERCGKFFSQKSHFDSHMKRKTPCENITEPFKVLSLFSGIGGMDMGFGGNVIVHKKSIHNKEFIKQKNNVKNFVELKPTNFKIIFQNDILVGAKEVCKINKTASNYNTTSIYDLLKEDYPFPAADVIIGGFPCQDFSHCGKRKGFSSDKTHDLKGTVNDQKDNSRGTLYKCFVEVVGRVKPKVFVAENVYGLLTMSGEPIKQIIKDFSDLGYDVEYQVIDCTEFGIPQTRKRVIIIGITKDRLVPNLPSNWYVIEKNKIKCNIGHYFEHLQEPDETTDLSQKLYSKAKKLEKGQGQKEIDLNSFAPTMRAEHHGNIEFRRHENTINSDEYGLPERRLTIREAGLIQTFPPEYIFTVKNNMTSYKYIGNAVPPLLGYIIADKINEIITTFF